MRKLAEIYQHNNVPLCYVKTIVNKMKTEKYELSIMFYSLMFSLKKSMKNITKAEKERRSGSFPEMCAVSVFFLLYDEYAFYQ